MKLIIQGTAKEYAEGTNIKTVIETENVETAEYVTVSVNDELYDSKQFESVTLSDGDVIEFLYFMGGGCI